MIDQIISALKISLGECRKYEDPAEYVYQLNSVLNRYKTNLYNLIKDKRDYLHDPREFFQFRIATSWRTRPGFGRVTTIIEQTPIMLHVNGFQALTGERRNKESNYNKAVRIDDVIDLERIASLKNDHYYCGLMASSSYVSEEDILREQLGIEKYAELSMYFTVDKVVDDGIVFTLQLNGNVVYSVVEQNNIEEANLIPSDPVISRRTAKLLREAAAAKLLAEPVEEVLPTTPVDVLFGTPRVKVTQSATPVEKEKVEPFRSKNNPGVTRPTGNVGLTRKKHKYW